MTGPSGYLEGQICPEKGLKTLFGQIWFAFSFMGLEKGSKWAKVCSKEPKRPQRGAKWVAMAQNRVTKLRLASGRGGFTLASWRVGVSFANEREGGIPRER